MAYEPEHMVQKKVKILKWVQQDRIAVIYTEQDGSIPNVVFVTKQEADDIQAEFEKFGTIPDMQPYYISSTVGSRHVNVDNLLFCPVSHGYYTREGFIRASANEIDSIPDVMTEDKWNAIVKEQHDKLMQNWYKENDNG